MPKSKAASKWARASQKREKRNTAVKSELKTLFKKAIAKEAAPGAFVDAASAFDKAAARGVIHKNKANRKKARLAAAARAKKA